MPIKENALEKLKVIYGDCVNEEILNRFNYEVNILINEYHLEEILNNVANYVKEEKGKGRILIPRLATNNSLLYYLIGISDVNPLPRHTYCQKCHTFHWGESKKEKSCQCCGEVLQKDGYDLPFDILLQSIEKGSIRFQYSSDEDYEHSALPIKLHKNSLARFVEELNIDINTLPSSKELTEIGKCLSLPGYYTQKYIKAKLCDHRPFVGVPEFGNKSYFKYAGLYDVLKNFDDFVKFFTLMHGTRVNDANNRFILGKSNSVQGCISSYDELYQLLKKYRIDKEDALRMCYEVREKSNAGLSKLSISQLEEAGVDSRYILFMRNIFYIFYKGHSVSHLRAVLNIANIYLKDPKRYYKVYFNINNELVAKVDKNSDLVKGYIEHKETELEEIYLALLDCKERRIVL